MGYEKLATKSDSQIAKHIRTTAKDSSRVFFTKHVKVRMTQRKVNAPEILDCTLNGTISRTPEASHDGPEPGMPDGALCCRQKSRDALHNSLRMGVVQVGMSCKAHVAVQ